jgi:hypothetical protein
MATANPSKAKQRSERKADPLAPVARREKCAVPARQPFTEPTPGGRELHDQLRLVELEITVHRLQMKLDLLEAAIDPEDVMAAHELRCRTPSTATLLRLAELGGQPAGLEDEPEERPW